jgi:hypothetical protein
VIKLAKTASAGPEEVFGVTTKAAEHQTMKNGDAFILFEDRL